jgi:membrane fusion protein (multidrug efflux system)
MNKKLLLVTGMLGILFPGTSCQEGKQQEVPNSRSLLQVEAIVAKPRRFENKFTATANLLAFEEVELRAPVSGTVLGIYFQEAQNVKQGDLLVRLDDRTLNAQIKGLKVQLEASLSDLRRKKELLKVEGVSEEEVEQSQAVVDGIKSSMDELTVSVNLANIRAPFDGRVGMRNFSMGSYLSQGQTITQLVQTQKLKVDFNLASRYLDEVKVGKKIKVISSSDTLEAEVYAISPFVNATSRTAQVRAIIQNNNRGFIPGDFAEVQVALNVDNEALVVPTDVIIPDLNAQTLFIYRNGRAMRTEVLLGSRTDTEVQILSGLSPGDTVLTTGLLQVKDLTQVEITEFVKPVTL